MEQQQGELIDTIGNIFNMLMRGTSFSTKIFLVMANKRNNVKSLCQFEDDMVHCFYVHVDYYIHILVCIHSLVLNSTTFIGHLLLYSIFVLSLFHPH
jgi:hypothetical protein